MEGPKFDEFRLNNRSEIKRQEHEELIYSMLLDKGVRCDECDELFMPEELAPKTDGDDNTILVCSNCQ